MWAPIPSPHLISPAWLAAGGWKDASLCCSWHRSDWYMSDLSAANKRGASTPPYSFQRLIFQHCSSQVASIHTRMPGTHQESYRVSYYCWKCSVGSGKREKRHLDATCYREWVRNQSSNSAKWSCRQLFFKPTEQNTHAGLLFSLFHCSVDWCPAASWKLSGSERERATLSLLPGAAGCVFGCLKLLGINNRSRI